MAKVCNDGQAVRNDQNRFSLPTGFAQLSDAFLLKRGISNGQHFIHDQNLGFEIGGDGECQSQIHPAGIMFDGTVE
jgi:hypothetical protein